MPDQNTDQKAQGQGQTAGTDANQENQVAFGGSEDFFDDPNFLNKIGQGQTSTNVEDNQDVKLGDLFEENKLVEPDENNLEDVDTLNHDIDSQEENKIEENLEKTIPEIVVEPEKKPVVESMPEIIEPVVDNVAMNDVIASEVDESPLEEAVEMKVESNDEKPVENVVENTKMPENNVVLEDSIEDDDDLDEEEINQPIEEEGSGFVKKFNELKITIKEIYYAKSKLGYEGEEFEVIGANSDRNKITYTFKMEDENNISIKKLEVDKKTEEESEHTLSLVVEEGKLNVWMDDMMLFEEIKDLEKDPKKQIQVNEKINKFLFLAGEYNNDMQSELREKLEEEQEKKKMQDIFRNF